MLPRRDTSKSLGWVLFLTALLATPVIAHEIKTSQNVGAIFHIEPNDAPRAGKPQLAWFALTQKGGKVIPLEDCNCQLAIYPEPYTEGSPPLQKPQLKAISIKRYQGIPGTEITFPKPGAYQLQLSGTPATNADFAPFELKFDVTVAPGIAALTPKTTPHTAQVTTQAEQLDNRWLIPAIAIGSIFTLGVVWKVWQKLK